MSYPDGYLFSWNDQVYPQAVVEPIVTQNDPIVSVICSYVQNLLANYVTPAFAVEASLIGLHDPTIQFTNGSALGSIVAYPLNPTLLQSTTYKFPLLSVYRETEDDIHFTLMKLMVKSNFVIQYVLPPLTPLGYNRLYSFLHYINETICTFFFQGNDPLYQNGAPVFKNAGLSYLTLTGAKYEPLVAMTDKQAFYFPTITLRFSCNERQKTVLANYEPFNDIYIETDQIDGYLPANPYTNIADGYVDLVLTLDSLSASSGPSAGGTNILIQGDGFTTVTGVSICNVPVSWFIVKSNNLLLVNTGATLTPGIGNVVVTAANTNSTATLTNAFTYV